MNKVPASVFDDELLPDLVPPPPVHRPPPEQVRVLAESADFRSREPLRPSEPSRRGKKRTGRTEQFACRITPEAAARFYQIAHDQDWTVGATVERALAALQEKMGG